MDDAALTLLWAVAVLNWGLAAAGGWAAWHHGCAGSNCQRRLRSVADYAAHKPSSASLDLRSQVRRAADAHGAQTEGRDDLAETALGVSHAGAAGRR